MAFYNYSWKYSPDTGRSIGSYIIFFRGGTIDHGTHVPGPVAQSSAESKYNAACTGGMALAHFSMLINELLKNDPDIVPEEAPVILLDIKYVVCISKNGKYTNNTRHISRRVNSVRNCDKFKMQKVRW